MYIWTMPFYIHRPPDEYYRYKKRRIHTVTRPAAKGMWLRRFIVERVTQSLRRMI